MNGPSLHAHQPLPPLDSWRARTFAELLSGADSRPALIGSGPWGDVVLTRADLARYAAAADAWRQDAGYAVGDSVILVRLPGTDEARLAAALVGLLAAGLRVSMPLFVSYEVLARAATHTRARAVIAALAEAQAAADFPDAAVAAARLGAWARGRRLPLLCPSADLHLHRATDGEVPHRIAPLTDQVWLGTSGSSGTPKLLRFDETAWMACGASFEAAGLLRASQGWGDTLVPMLGHTLGLRAVVLALWSGHAAIFVPPEWLERRPWDVVRLLEAHPPRHITCGPALIHVFGAYARHFPRVADRVLPRLHTVVSSGAPFDVSAAAHLSDTRLANALGTSETQQILSSLLGPSDAPPQALGAPLPGVELRLVPTAVSSTFRLRVRSPFAARGYAGEPDFEGDIDTGDLVHLLNGHLLHAGRAEDDAVSTGPGLKLDAAALEGEALGVLTRWADDIVLCAHPAVDGLLALVFTGARPPDNPAIRADIVEALSTWQAQRAASNRESAWRTRVEACAVLEGWPPRRGPGKVDRRGVAEAHQALLDALADPLSRHPGRLPIHVDAPGTSAARRHYQPRTATLMELLHLDWVVEGGRGDHLRLRRGGHRCEVLDLVGGFGANLLGHGNARLRDAAVQALDAVPLLDQGLSRPTTANLAEELALRVGRQTGRRYVVALASTGSEAIELALKHAMLELSARFEAVQEQIRQGWGGRAPELARECLAHNEAQLARVRPLILALEGGYHGKTLGALHMMGSDAQRQPFHEALGADVLLLPIEASEHALARRDAAVNAHTMLLKLLGPGSAGPAIQPLPLPRVIALVVEPIQGEAGVRIVDPRWINTLRVRGAPVVIDEIQAGLGRTGTFLASDGARGDYYVFGKALGGGFAKIGALLIDRTRYVAAFDPLRGSTFSGDSLSAAVARTVLATLDQEDAPARARLVGASIGAALARVAARHPEVVRGVRGRGAMWGLELGPPSSTRSTLVDALCRQGLGYLAASYLLNNHGVRVLPTLSAPDTLRIEPSIYLADADVAWMERGLHALCTAIEQGNLLELVAHLVVTDEEHLEQCRHLAASFSAQDVSPFVIHRDAPAPGARRVAFVHNPVHPAKLLLADAPPMGLLSSAERLALIDRLQDVLELAPMRSFGRNLFDGRVWLRGITMAATPAALEYLKHRGDLGLVRRRMQEALDLAVAEGCEIVVFGAHTSIVTDAATTLLAPEGVTVCSGNSFTTAVAWQALLDAVERHGAKLAGGQVAIVGATGNIGQALAGLLVAMETPPARVWLVGRPGADSRLLALRRELAGRIELGCAVDLDVLTTCDVVICATSTPEPIVHAAHLAEGRPVVVLDVSQPRAVGPDVASGRPNARVVGTGYVRLPADPDFQMSPHTDPGQAFACASEGLLLALDPQPGLTLTGPLDPRTIDQLRQLGRKHGLL